MFKNPSHLFSIETSKRTVSAAVVACMLAVSLSTVSFADVKRVTLTGLEAKTQENQIVMYLSGEAKASFSAPTDNQGNRVLLIDLQGVQVPKVDNKEELLESIKNALPDVSQITMSEFGGSQPMIRLAIKTSAPDIAANLVPGDANELVLQLVNPRGNAPKTITRVVEQSAYIGTRDGVVQTPSITPKKAPDPYVSADRYEADRITAPVYDYRNSYNRAVANPHQFPRVSGSNMDQHLDIDLPPYHATDKYRQVALSKGLPDGTAGTTTTRVQGQVENYTQPIPKPVSPDTSSRVYGRVEDSLPLSTSSAQYEQLRAEKAALEARLSALQQQQSALIALQQENATLKQQLSARPASVVPSSSTATGHLIGSVRDLSQANMGMLVAAENSFRKGVQFERAGQLNEAISSYRQAVESAPQVPEYPAALGRLFIDQRNLGAARQILEGGLRQNPANAEILNELGKVSLLEGRTEEAASYFRKALPSGVMSNYASTLMKLEKFPDAERAYLVAIASNPGDSDLYYNLGNLYLAQQQYTNAVQLYQNALKYQSNLPEAHYQMGIAYAQMGQRANAVQSLRNYLNASPSASNRQSVEQFINELQRG